MNTYTLLSGEVIEYPNQPAAVSRFIARVTAAAADPAVTPTDVLALVYGVENPLLDTTSQPGRAIVTRAAFENPVYHLLTDLLGRKQTGADGQTREDVAAAFTVTVKDAAGQLGLTESSVRTAITGRKLSAVKRNGDWYIHPNSVASYTVSNRGRKKPARSDAPTGPAPVRVTCGSTSGGSLSVRIAGAELVVDATEGNTVRAHFPAGWTRAAVRTTSPKGTRVFEIEPAEGELAIEFNGLSVTGPFAITKKNNATAAASAAWKRYEREPAAV